MYGRAVTYPHSEDRDALGARARAGVIPIVTALPGYIAYCVMVLNDKVVSVSAWESEDHAKAGDAALLDWVKNNTTMQVDTRVAGDSAWPEWPAFRTPTDEASRTQ